MTHGAVRINKIDLRIRFHVRFTYQRAHSWLRAIMRSTLKNVIFTM